METKLEPSMQEHIIDIPPVKVQVNKHVIDIGEDSLELRSKSSWLDYVGAADCIKDKVRNFCLMQLSKIDKSQIKKSNQGKQIMNKNQGKRKSNAQNQTLTMSCQIGTKPSTKTKHQTQFVYPHTTRSPQ